MAKDYVQNLLGENERILLVTRQHWFVLFSNIALEILLIILIALGVTAAIPFYPAAVAGYVLVLVPLVGMVRDILIWSNREYIVTKSSAVDKVKIYPGRNGKRAQNTVDIDLVLNLILSIDLIGGFRPANPDLSAAIITHEMQIGWSSRRSDVTAGLCYRIDNVARGDVAARVVRNTDAETVRSAWRQVTNDSRQLVRRGRCCPAYGLSVWATIHVEAVVAAVAGNVVGRFCPG